MMLRADELARIQAVNDSWLNQTCTITAPSTAVSAAGWQSGQDTIATGVACRAEPSGAQGGMEHVVADGVMSGASWSIILPAGTIANPQSTIVVTGVGTFNVLACTVSRGVPTDVVATCVKADAL